MGKTERSGDEYACRADTKTVACDGSSAED